MGASSCRVAARPPIPRLVLPALLLLVALLLGSARPAGAAPAHQVVRLSAVPLRVPILMYHYVRVDSNPRDVLGANLSISPARFADQMAFLVAHGYHTISLDDLVWALRNGAALPPRPMILTFDDGYADFYTTAYPVLRRLDLKATSFVITGKVGWPGYLTWDEMRLMQASGLVQFESHTVDHVEVAHISLAQAQYQLTTSKAALEAHLGVPVRYFDYPVGDYDAAVERLLAADGYRAAVTTRPGVWQSTGALYALPRVRIFGNESVAGLAGQLGAFAH